MTPEEVIKTLKIKRECYDWEGLSCDSKESCRYCEVAMDIAIETLEKYRWIPCSERLPEDENPVLIQYYDEDDDVVMAVGWMEYGYLMTYDDRIFNVYEEVAWMPLPEPYKEEK